MVVMGRANSHMKEYYDVWMLTGTVDLDPDRMRQAIAATLARRSKVIPKQVPDGLSDAFADDPAKQRQWNAFVRDLTRPVPQLGSVVADLRNRLVPVLATR